MLRTSSLRLVFAALRSPRAASLLLLGLAPACIEVGDGGLQGGGAGDAEVRSCKDACGQLKFFDCADAADHSACFGACEEASSSDIEVFVSCVRNDICDPACVDSLVQSSPPPSGEGGGEGGVEGSDPDACVSACQDYLADGCMEPVDCSAACAALPADERSFLVYCESRRSGCELPSECAGELEPDPTAECRAACDSLQFFDCIDAEQHASCRSLCASVDEDARATFTACADDGICSDAACYDVLADGGDGEGEGGGVGEGGSIGPELQELCAGGCDDMVFWDCIDATQHAECRSQCGAAEDPRIETFIGCLGIDPTFGNPGTCDDAGCYEAFLGV